jgi:transposase-like protein
LRNAAAAKRLFRQALSDSSHPQPRVINTERARAITKSCGSMTS